MRWRLSVAFAGIAALGALAIGLVLVPILATHYANAEGAYLEGAAERAVRDLAVMGWKDTDALQSEVETLALVTQARVTVTDTNGKVVAQAGPPTASAGSPDAQSLPDPLGAGLFGGTTDPATLPRSGQTIVRPVNKPAKAGSDLLGYVRISEAPAYEQVALMNVLEAWSLASLFGVAVAAAVGLLVASWLSRPLRTLAAATERMGSGDLSARAVVDREDEIGRLAGSFNAMAGRVEANVVSLRRFVADAAHEIGTPLTALQADLDLAERHVEDPDGRRLIGRALEQSERLGALSSSLLRLSRLEAGDAGDPTLEPLDVSALVLRVADAFSSRAAAAGVALLVAADPAPLVVRGDVDRLGAAVGALLDNALKFTPGGGTVRAEVAKAGDEVLVSISDTGMGVPSDDLPLLFERFHRARNAAGYPGSGLGLAIVRATVESMGGTVRAGNAGPGLRVELRFPPAG
jgi:two-component system, OmpR family, sensor histidine kinase BaeS